MKYFTNGWLLGILLMLGVISCNHSSSSKSSSSNSAETHQIIFDWILPAYLNQVVGAYQITPEVKEITTAQLAIHNLESNEITTHEWPLTLDEPQQSLSSSKALELPDGDYQLAFVFTHQDQSYATLSKHTISGDMTLPMTLLPVFGNPISSVEELFEIATVEITPSSSEIKQASHPYLGIKINQQPEKVFALLSTNNLSKAFLNLDQTEQSLEFRHYDGSLQKEVAYLQILESLNPGQTLRTQLEVIISSIDITFLEDNGDTEIRFQIPNTVVEGVTDVSTLRAWVSVAQDETILLEEILSLTLNSDGSYQVITTLTDPPSTEMVLSLQVVDTTTSPETLIANCFQSITLSGSSQNARCELSLRRPDQIGDPLLSVLGINVFDEQFIPVPGATITLNGLPVGISGSGTFGTPGYLRQFVVSGDYMLRATALGMIGLADASLEVFGIHNQDIFLTEVNMQSFTITGTRYALEIINWDGSLHQQGGITRAGGYLRTPASPYDFETLATFDVSNISGTVTSATLRFNVTGGNMLLDRSVILYEQDISEFDPNTVTYESFNFAPFASVGWQTPLAETAVNANQPQTHSMQAPQLRDLVQRWINDPLSNRGVVLTGNFFYWDYFINIDHIELVVEVTL